MRLTTLGLGALGLAAVGAVALAAAGIGGGAFAQTPAEDGAKRGERYRELLAEELGITVEELTEAQTAARDRLIDEKLAAGEITAEQAERLKSLEPGEGLWIGIGRHMLGHKIHGAIVSVFEAAADVTGVPVDELRERLAGGESLAEIAASQSIDEETLKADLHAALTTKINEAVAADDLDQDKADMLLENLDEMIERAIDAEAPFGGLRFGGPRGERFFDRLFR